MPNVLILDPFHKEVLGEFSRNSPRPNAYVFANKPNLKTEAEIIAELASGNYNVLIVGSKEISENILKAWREKNPDRELYVIRAGSDPSHIEFGVAAKLGITVLNTPGASLVDVTDYIVSRLPKDGNGKTVALIGYGAIGQEVEKVLRLRKFKVQLYSPSLNENTALPNGIIYMPTPAAAIESCDYIIPTAHLVFKKQATALNEVGGEGIALPSEAIFNESVLKTANKGVTIINCSRPWLFDINAVQEHQKKGDIGAVHFNTTPHDISILTKNYPALVKNKNSDIRPSSEFLTEASKINTARRALEVLTSIFEQCELISPVFGPKAWDKLKPKKTIAFVGGGIVGVVSALKFVEEAQKLGKLDQYTIKIIEEADKIAAGTTFCNGGNLTPTESLPFAKPGNEKKVTQKFPEGWLVKDIGGLTEGQRSWCNDFYNICKQNNARKNWETRASHIVALGKHSMEEWQELYKKYPTILEEAQFQYGMSGLVRFYTKSDTMIQDFDTLSKLGIPIQTLEKPDIEKFDKVYSGLYQNISGAILQPGGCMNTRDFTRKMALFLQQKFGVELLLDTKITSLGIKGDRIEELLTADKKNIKVDEVVFATGTKQEYFKDLKIKLPMETVFGATITIPIINTENFPRKPLKLITDDGVIVFSPHVSGDKKELRVGGMFGLGVSGENLDKFKEYCARRLEKYTGMMFPDLLDNAYRHNGLKDKACFEWVGGRPMTPDGLPFIGKVPGLSNALLNIGQNAGGSSYAPGCAELIVKKILGLELSEVEEKLLKAFAPGRFDLKFQNRLQEEKMSEEEPNLLLRSGL